ncbi:MAG: alpha/beta hydrolase [Proteobacteria bacterium]|nr:alpha/beta hydrolase [Pseudomonadota bacterium]
MRETPETRWIEVSGCENAKLLTESLGTGQPFIWAHSLLGSMAQDLEGEVLAWRELTDVARVIRYDARGHGCSEVFGKPEDFRWDKLANTLWQVADTYTEDKVIVGGASMGCATSLYAACQRPEQVKAMVLVIPPTAWELRAKMKRNYSFIAKFVNVTRGLPFRLLKLIPAAGGDAGFQRRVMSVMARHLAKANYKGVVGAMRGAALSDLPPLEELKKLTMPVLILAWPDDPTHPLSIAEKLHDTLPNSQLEVIESADDPYAWPQLVRGFITSLPRARNSATASRDRAKKR